MKQFLGAILALGLTFSVPAQYIIKGNVAEEQDGKPVEGVTVSIERDNELPVQRFTGKNGDFSFLDLKKKGNYRISTSYVGMQPQILSLDITEAITSIKILLKVQDHYLEPLEVKSLRASDKAPFAKTNISKQEIEKNNLGQDLPFLLDQTPSVVVNSDAGNGVGYTGIRIRGSDATRINVTLNGIPYNDAESQGTYFVDLPDIASSLNSIQIQRGVGTSSNGSGAFGASINLSTNELNDHAYGQLNNSFGSFNTWKNTVKAGTGLIDDHFTVDARLSRLTSNGFIDRAATSLKSLYLSAAYLNKSTSVRFNYISGTEKTYQAWNGIDQGMLNSNRTYNSAGTEKPGEPYDNETDNYKQDHYQLFLNHAFNDKLSFNTAMFLTKGKGYYEQYKAGAKFLSYGLPDLLTGNTTATKTDLVRQLWLDNDYYGQVASLQYRKANDQLTFGGGWNIYNGNHFGKIIWAQTGIPKDYRWYDLDATKQDENVYAKWQHSIGSRWTAFADLQYRHVYYSIGGFRDNPGVIIKRKFDFVNPKIGVSYSANDWRIYASYAIANKEPNRDDYEAGVEAQPKYETLQDYELGIERRKSNYSMGASAYYMKYRNQLVLTGKINDVGAYTRLNVAESYRLGLELQAALTVAKWINLTANITLSKNKVGDYEEFLDDYDNGGQKSVVHSNREIAFSPAVTGAANVTFTPLKKLELSLPAKYVSRQYLDNTQDINRSLNAYYVQDIRVSYALDKFIFKQWNITAQVKNVFSKKYEPNGYTYSYISSGRVETENYYFPMATTNIIIGVNVTL